MAKRLGSANRKVKNLKVIKNRNENNQMTTVGAVNKKATKVRTMSSDGNMRKATKKTSNLRGSRGKNVTIGSKDSDRTITKTVVRNKNKGYGQTKTKTKTVRKDSKAGRRLVNKQRTMENKAAGMASRTTKKLDRVVKKSGKKIARNTKKLTKRMDKLAVSPKTKRIVGRINKAKATKKKAVSRRQSSVRVIKKYK